MQTRWTLRKAGLEDMEALLSLRLALWKTVRGVDSLGPEEPQLVEANRRYFQQAIPAGRFHAWLGVAGDAVVAGSGLVPFERPPAPGNPLGLEAYILNMYTLPAWRGQGIARALLMRLLAFSQELGVSKVWLHASAEGRPLYESVGFVPNDTRLEWVPPAK
jgi:GNAT superfamily N-acetyltransferase